MTVRKLTNEDLLDLLPLYVNMISAIDKDTNTFGAINTLMNEINTKKDFSAVGLYKGDTLIGFMSGYCFTKKQFHFSGIYVKIKNNSGLKTLIDFSLALVKSKGYSAWSSNASNSNISSIMRKYGAKAVSGKFLGVL